MIVFLAACAFTGAATSVIRCVIAYRERRDRLARTSNEVRFKRNEHGNITVAP